uniref:Uncharacterized protein n=1 Tax=Oryza meridionalis TaxID=40149 RepID=A0A0E0CYJ8_9ORYZ
MEGLLPFVYRAIVHKRDGHRAIGNPFLNDDPAAAATAYKRLATCDSGTYSRPGTTVDAPFLGGEVVTLLGLVFPKGKIYCVKVVYWLLCEDCTPCATGKPYRSSFQISW